MKRAVLTLAAASLLCAADRGLPVRGSVADYPAHGDDKGVVVAADLMDPEQVKGTFATDLSQYAVIEVAVWPSKDGKPLDLSSIDFALHADGRMIRPAEPRSIAGINQRKSQSRSRDIALYPNVGVTTGTWGTGTMVGVGIGPGGNAPGPASTDRDRHVMEMELEDKGLRDAVITQPVAGYLYFPIGKTRASSYQLEYSVNGIDVKMTLQAPKKK